MNGLVIRLASRSDILELVKIEHKVWGALGTDIFESELYDWLEVYPEGFLVAEKDGRLVGFCYFQAILVDIDSPRAFTTFNKMTDHGRTRKTHNPNGNYHFGITICSTISGTGRALERAVLDYSVKVHKPLLSISRMPGLNNYLERIKKNADVASLPNEDAVALYYAVSSVIIVGGHVSNSLIIDQKIDLPSINGPDPVLSKYAKNVDIELRKILPNFMKDPQSRNYGALLVQK